MESPDRPLLHLSNDFMHQEVYPQLVAHLEGRGLYQWVFVAARDPNDIPRSPKDTANTSFAVRHVLKRHHKVFFRMKAAAMTSALEDCFPVRNAALIHAHFLYTDGTVAAAMHRKYGVPFVVSVRPTTDVFAFMRYRPDLLGTAVSTLRDASAVICITPGGRDLLLGRLPRSERVAIDKKICVISSAISTAWHEPPESLQPSPTGSIRLISISDMTRNKNMRAVIDAAEILSQRSVAVELTLVGGLRERLPSRLPDWVRYIPHICDKRALRDLVRTQDVFVMPSFAETFGLSYVEALSQGVPVVHSRGQAVEGLFTEGVVSMGVDPRSPTEIAAAIEHLSSGRTRNWRQCISETLRFRWNLVAEQLHGVYSEAVATSATQSSPL